MRKAVRICENCGKVKSIALFPVSHVCNSCIEALFIPHIPRALELELLADDLEEELSEFEFWQVLG